MNVNEETYKELDDENMSLFDLYVEAKNEVYTNFKYKIEMCNYDKFGQCQYADIFYSNNKEPLINKVISEMSFDIDNGKITKKEITEMVIENNGTW